MANDLLTGDLYADVNMPRFNDALEHLVSVMENEEWGENYYILKNYLIQTYKKLVLDYSTSDEKSKCTHILIRKEKMCFNTGLFNRYYEPIYFSCSKNTNSADSHQWFGDLFLAESDQQMFEDFGEKFNFPKRAFFFDKPSDLVYDSRFDIVINVPHILDDSENTSRLPKELSKTSQGKKAEILRAAIETAKKQAQANYKIAIPQYYQQKVQLLLPLSVGIEDDGKPNLALVVYKSEKENQYRGYTCLRTAWAYMNARLLVKPESSWLIPSKQNISDTISE
jgi:hypothetical protein